MMATAPHVTSGSGLRKFQADGFLLTRVYLCLCYLGYEINRTSVDNLTLIPSTYITF